MPEKITRDAFLFFGARGPQGKNDFAQCGPCRMFVPSSALPGTTSGRCIIHGTKVEIDEDDSCGFMCGWPTPDGKPNPQVVKDHAEELMKNIPGSVTPEISGLVSRRVQCHRCFHADPRVKRCILYAKLNKQMPDIWDLEEAIEPNTCCNAQTPKGGKISSKRQVESGSDGADDDDAPKQPMFGRMAYAK